jgi:DNA-binding protein Fis
MTYLLLMATDCPLQQSSSSAFDWDRFVTDRINAGTNSLYAQALEHMEQEVLVRVLKYTNGNQLQAAKILGITRGSLRNKIRSLGIEITREIRGSEDAG